MARSRFLLAHLDGKPTTDELDGRVVRYGLRRDGLFDVLLHNLDIAVLAHDDSYPYLYRVHVNST